MPTVINVPVWYETITQSKNKSDLASLRDAVKTFGVNPNNRHEVQQLWTAIQLTKVMNRKLQSMS